MLYRYMSESGDSSVFDRLAKTLPREERERMLESVRAGMEHALAPLLDQNEPIPPAVIEQVRTLGLWRRFRLLVEQILYGASREEVVTRWTVTAMRNQVQKTTAPALDMKRLIANEPFVRALEEVRVAMNEAVPLLEDVSANRAELIFRLAAVELARINHELLYRTSPEHLEEQDEKDERVLRHNLIRFMEDKLAEIPTASAGRMRRTVAQIDQLSRLVQFPFATMVGSFSGTPDSGGGRTCALDYLQHSLERLVTELEPLADPLEPAALETIVMVETPDGTGEDYQALLEARFRIIATAIDAVRDFATRFPLRTVVRVIRENPWWQPQAQENTGNDWLSVYRRTMEERISREALRVALHRQVSEQLDRLAQITGDPVSYPAGLIEGAGYRALSRYHTLAVLITFSTSYRRNTMSTLRMILTGADFYKSSNRAQYNDAFGEYERIPADLEALMAVSAETTPAARMDEEIGRMSDRVTVTVEMLVNVLGGILYARPGSSYDSIANYGQIGGRRNAELIEEIRDIHGGLQQIAAVMMEVAGLEKRARDQGIRLRYP